MGLFRTASPTIFYIWKFNKYNALYKYKMHSISTIFVQLLLYSHIKIAIIEF